MRYNKQQWCLLSAIMLILLTLIGCGTRLRTNAAGRQDLFNGKNLSGWTMVSQDPAIPISEVWSVKEGVLNCAGKPNGYLRTTEIYSNFYLHLEWRWTAAPANSGVLLLCQSPDQVWPQCIECQLMADHAGDFVLIGGTGLTVDGTRLQNEQQRYVVIEKKTDASEKDPGEWNTYDIYCTQDRIRCLVNGVVQNEGSAPSVTWGMIGLQSEGGPIQFRNIYIKPLSSAMGD